MKERRQLPIHTPQTRRYVSCIHNVSRGIAEHRYIYVSVCEDRRGVSSTVGHVKDQLERRGRKGVWSESTVTGARREKGRS